MGGTTLGKSAIKSQTAKTSRLWGGKIRTFPAGFEVVRALSAEEIERRFGMRKKGGWNSKRGEVKKFTDKSLVRCISTYSKIGREDPPMMVTLTYRSEVKWETSKEDLRMFFQWIQREIGGAGVWRLEVQKRGVIHYHVLVWSPCANDREVGRFEAMEMQLKRKWCEITGQGFDEDRMREGLHIRPCGNDAAARRYLAGHSIKKEQQAYYKGRHWGIFNRKALDIGKAREEINLTDKQLVWINRIHARRIAARNGGRKFDFNRKWKYVSCNDAWQTRKVIDWVMDNF